MNIMHWNTFDTQINVLTDEIQTYEWMHVTQISHIFINPSFKCVFNAQCSCVKCMNYEWMNFAQFALLSHEMLSLWCIAFCYIINLPIFFWCHNLALRNNPLLFFLHWSFIQADVAMITNNDTPMPMPLKLNFQDFWTIQFHPMKVVPNFQPCFLTLLCMHG
jgi:hypothetical protein